MFFWCSGVLKNANRQILEQELFFNVHLFSALFKSSLLLIFGSIIHAFYCFDMKKALLNCHWKAYNEIFVHALANACAVPFCLLVMHPHGATLFVWKR